MNITQALLDALKQSGAKAVFGIPGDFALPYFKVLHDSAILPLITFSHEPAVGFAADAAGRYLGGLGVAAVTYGAGALNMTNAVAQAYAEKSPLVVISGAPGTTEASRGMLLHHQAKTLDSQFRIYQEITCDQAVLDNPATAPAEIARVLQSCKAYSRPVYIEIPRDMPTAECGPVPEPEPLPMDPDAVKACAREILARLRAAERPVMLAGVEIRRYGLEADVEKLARALGLPVVSSFMGSGLLSCYEDLAGTYLGMAGDPAVTNLVEDSDGLMLLGVIFSDTNFGVSQKAIDLRRTIQVADRKVSMGYYTYADIPLPELVRALLAASDETPAAPGVAVTCPGQERPTGLTADETTLTPRDIATGINDLIAEHGQIPLAVDVGDCMFTSLSIAQTPLVCPGYYASMGFGVPAGMGIQAVSGERPIILAGDGGFQMTGWELGHCKRLGLDPIVVVFNNSSWELLRTFQPGMSYHDLGEWRFADLANVMGGKGYRATTRAELKDALTKAHATRGTFQLIEAMLPQGALSDTMTRFVASMRKKTVGLED